MSNKDEALRAKELAESWMSKSEFTTARRVAIKAQKMDETLENVVARMIMVCDVHCAAKEKCGDEMDWYKILQVDQNADDNTIKKQYRRLALCLHPDKNTLPGAESAFKTIGEAQRILLDKDQRRLHDIKRKPVSKRPAPASASSSFQHHQAPPRSFFTQPVFQTNVNATRKVPETQTKPQVQPTGVDGSSSFRTSCPFCHRKYEYEREFINKPKSCVSCGKQYIAFQESSHGPPNQKTSAFYQPRTAPTQEVAKGQEKKPEKSAKISSNKEGSSFRTSCPFCYRKYEHEREFINKPKNCVSCGKQYIAFQESSHGPPNQTSSAFYQPSKAPTQEAAKGQEKKPEKSAKISSSKEGSRAKKSSSSANINGKRKRKMMVESNDINCSDSSIECEELSAGDSSSGSKSAEIYECPDPDFSNFEKSRDVMCFKAGQMWTMYDDKDGMPRYYAVIRKVIRKPFMLKIQWLEANLDDEKAVNWVSKNLPISVGKYKLGGNMETNETPMFSHLIHCRTGSMNDTFRVYPRIGETWALFKNWDIKWSSGRRRSSHNHEYEYEFVEILSEYAEGFAIEVAFLRKIEGFASVFSRIAPGCGSDTMQIPPHEFLRFSHSIPSTKLTGTEAIGVPVGSFELDTAAVPLKIKEEAAPVSREAAKSNQGHHYSPPEPDCVFIPSFQFHNFSDERLVGKFAPGQVWSLSSKEDNLPKCYAKIQKIEWRPVFKLHINRLEPRPFLENVKQWRDNKMPVSCGYFTSMEGQNETLTKVTGFSHLIIASQPLRQNDYFVLPKTGEIWAMYKNWSETINVSSLKKCQYEVVEVLDDNDSHIEVMMLERVDGFISVFRGKVEGGIDVKKKIPRCELLRFSHYVPSFRLTGEVDEDLRGCVELDSSALPRNLLR